MVVEGSVCCCRTALLKGKRFYKFANKSKEEKQAILQKKKEQQSEYNFIIYGVCVCFR